MDSKDIREKIGKMQEYYDIPLLISGDLDRGSFNMINDGTEYGMQIYQANDEYLKGDYDKSADTWREVLRLNGNYNTAFIGIGRSQVRQEKYEEAMENFKMAHDRENYGRAYRYYRKIVIERNIGWVVAIIAAVLLIPLIIGRVRKMKEEVKNYERTGLLG